MKLTRMTRGCTLMVLVPALSVWAAAVEHPSVRPARSDRGAAAPTANSPDPKLRQQISRAVAALSDPQAREPGNLLPVGTTVDQIEWVGNVLHIYVTVPVTEPKWRISDLEAESISQALSAPFWADPAFGGTVLRARAGHDQPYGTLEQFILSSPRSASRASPEPSETLVSDDDTADVQPGTDTRLGGPVAQAARQPTGALTGVTVFASAGHGWTAGSSAWYLQRPVLLGMAEDYGNIDQLNYFVHYAFNAGATVVPFRPVGWQDLEIVLDNDDPGVTYTGSWTDSTATSHYYENNVTVSGVGYRFVAAETTETATARYSPNITVTDFYPVYCFARPGTNRTIQTYRVKHSGGITEVAIDHREVGDGWIWLGEYYLEAGGDNYVEITNQSPESGAIIADAIRWGGGMGDIVRPGPGMVSGYPRDEECQRYWAHSELGNNGVGYDSDIWDGGGDDGGDNVRCGGKWAREMNQVPGGGILVDRWKRIHLEFHTNASSGSARGQICLITDLGATTYQEEYATMLSNEIDADLLIVDDEFEFAWVDRSSPTYTSSYGAICTGANDDEFDATIVELAFHDNDSDAKLLRDDRVRAAMARACVHGIIRFLNWLPDSQVPLAFPPDTPRNVQATSTGTGDIVLSWTAPLSDGARGDPATGYVIYQSTNGYGFGNSITVGNVLSATVSDVPAGEARYFRVAATNAGGESMPSETLAVRRSEDETSTFLVVNGFDRLRRQQNPVQTFTQPAGYAGQSIERQIWRRSNSFDYVIQHAEALAAGGATLDSCSNDAVIAQALDLEDYPAVVWITGEESTADATFDSSEQSEVGSYLDADGNLLVSGAEIGWNLDAQGGGASFYNNYLKADYVSDDAGTYNVATVAGSIFDGISSFSFDDGDLFYDVDYPDVLSTYGGSTSALNYVGGSGGIAGIVYDGSFKVVNFGFPFETITTPSVQEEVMDRIISFFFAGPFDADRDGDVDLHDLADFVSCLQGPDVQYSADDPCLVHDADDDLDVDLSDFSEFTLAFTGE